MDELVARWHGTFGMKIEASVGNTQDIDQNVYYLVNIAGKISGQVFEDMEEGTDGVNLSLSNPLHT